MVTSFSFTIVLCYTVLCYFSVNISVCVVDIAVPFVARFTLWCSSELIIVVLGYGFNILLSGQWRYLNRRCCLERIVKRE